MYKVVILWWLALITAGRVSAQQLLDPGFRPAEVLRAGTVTQLIEQPDGGRVVVGRFSRTDQGAAANVVRYLPGGAGIDYAFQQRLGGVTWSYNFPSAKPLSGGRLLLYTLGPIATPSLTRWGLMALTAQGRPDSTFDAALGNGLVQCVLVQPDGKILVGGQFTQAGGQTLTAQLIRLLPNGQLDASFTAPQFTPVFSSLNIYALALQPDGSILVGGEFAQPARALCRLRPNGQLDASFAANAGTGTVVQQLAVQPDGNLLVGGRIGNNVPSRTAGLLRLLPTGGLDVGFQAPGNLDCYGYTDTPQIEVLADGRLLVQGGPFGSHRVARLLATGALDTSFPLNDALPFPDYMSVYTCTRLRNGNWLLGGAFSSFDGQRGSVIEYTFDGQPVGGPRPRVSEPSLVSTLAVQPDGKILVGGDFNWLNGAPADNLGRLRPNGDADTTFNARCGTDGMVYKVALLPTGEVLAGGSFRLVNGQNSPALVRLAATGQPDAGFVPFPTSVGPSGLVTRVTALLPLAGGDVVVGGNLNNNQHSLLRLGRSGQQQWAYNVGVVQTLGLQPDGKILAAGSRLTRVLPGGQLDPSLQYAAGSSDMVRDLAVQPDGRILLTGQLSISGGVRQLTRVSPTGALDASFTPLGRSNTGSSSLLLLPDGRVMMSGGSAVPAGPVSNSFGLWRYFADGSPDFSMPSLLGQALDHVATMALQPDGQLLIGGSFKAINGNPQFSLARLTAASVLPVRPARAAAELDIYPNPSHDYLVVTLAAAARPQRLTLLDLLGRPALTRPVAATARQLTLDVRGLPVGAYLLRVDYADGPVTRRVVVE